MLNLLLTLLYFFIAIAILIAVHEYGHFSVARLLGVKVLRFSLGFGKPLLQWRGKKDTEYVIAAIPLGGYVKMLDESEEQVPEELLPQAFNRKPVWIRIAVVLAGPLFNILFAIVALWLMFMIGITSLAPIVGEVATGSIAAVAHIKNNDEIIAVNGHAINSWRLLQLQLMPLFGTLEPVQLQVHNIKTGEHRTLSLDISHWQLNPKEPDLLGSLGISPELPAIPAVINKVLPNYPAAVAGLKAGDEILAVNAKPMRYWNDVVKTIQNLPNQTVNLTVKRNHHTLTLSLTPRSILQGKKEIGFIGAQSTTVSWPAAWIRIQHYSPVAALGQAVTETWMLTKTTFLIIEKFVTGRLSLSNISGPIGIAQGASQSAQIGFTSYLSFLALVSISLGVLNILPIPLLDGGHLFYYVYEIIFRKPVSEPAKMIGMKIGMLLLLALMLLAVFNDVSRLVS